MMTLSPAESVAEQAALIAEGEIELTGTPVLAWLTEDQTEPVMVDLAYVETIADQCAGCYTYVVEDLPGAGIRWCGWRSVFCPDCWTDEPHYCTHPEHH